ncbi:MAG: Uncharacterised protein [Synechococcus sp. MIT S9220]|nr:MAG: Uncharacterised protein [Synechococcus sp. MIT S9220]
MSAGSDVVSAAGLDQVIRAVEVCPPGRLACEVGLSMNQRAATGLLLVLLLGLITHCAARTRVRVQYRVLPQQGPLPQAPAPSQQRNQRPGVLM